MNKQEQDDIRYSLMQKKAKAYHEQSTKEAEFYKNYTTQEIKFYSKEELAKAILFHRPSIFP